MLVWSAWTGLTALAHKLPLAGTTAQPRQPCHYAHLQVLFESGLKERQAFIEAHMRRLTQRNKLVNIFRGYVQTPKQKRRNYEKRECRHSTSLYSTGPCFDALILLFRRSRFTISALSFRLSGQARIFRNVKNKIKKIWAMSTTMSF